MLNIFISALLLVTTTPTFSADDMKTHEAEVVIYDDSVSDSRFMEAFNIIESEQKSSPDDPRKATLLSSAFAIRAKRSSEIQDKSFWSQKSDSLINDVIYRNPDYLLARATRGVNNSLSPRSLGLSDKARADFEKVLEVQDKTKTPDDEEAVIISSFYYAQLIEREVEAENWPQSDLQRSKRLRTILSSKYPDAYRKLQER